MAVLLPSEYDLGRLEPSERKVVQAFLDGLDDSWFVVPNVAVFDGGQDGEIDVVIASLEGGVFVVETKGGQIRVDGNHWFQNERPMNKTPFQQVVTNRHLLVRRLHTIGLRAPWLNQVVALPDVGSVPEAGLGPGAPRQQIFGRRELQYPSEALRAARQNDHAMTPRELTRFLHALNPQITLGSKDASLYPVAAARIDEATRQAISAVVGLDSNRRVLVTGGAGTGKTWLIEQWARRAADRGERTLVICFNRPIADHLERQLENDLTMVGTYHDVVNRLLEGIYEFDVPPGAGEEYWGFVPTRALIDNIDRVGRRFDTIVIDEFQDVRHNWMPSIELLFAPESVDGAATRLLLVADPGQDIYVRDWQPPEGLTTLALAHNLRSSRPVAEVVHRLGGPSPMPGAVGSFPVLHWRAGGIKEIRKRLITTLEALTLTHGIPLSQIAVLTTKTDLRDELMDPDKGNRRLPLVRWEGKDEDAALCETIHRGKGLERAAVVIVDRTNTPDRQLLYIGASRAMWSLTLIGGAPLAEACGIESNSAHGHSAFDVPED